MPIIKQKEQRVGVFIDTQNLYHSAKNLYKTRVNFSNVLKEAVAGRNLIRAIAYLVTTESGEEKNFFEALAKMGIETKTKEIDTVKADLEAKSASLKEIESQNKEYKDKLENKGDEAKMLEKIKETMKFKGFLSDQELNDILTSKGE